MVNRDLRCAGGPSVQKHVCGEANLTQLELGGGLKLQTCAGTSRFSIEWIKGNYACECSLDKGRVFHAPLLQDPIAHDSRWFMDSNCPLNLVNALTGRVGMCASPGDPDVIAKLLNPIVDFLARKVGKHSQLPYSLVYAHYDRAKFLRYQKAHQELEAKGGMCDKKDSCVTCFVKREGIKFNPSKVNPACRAIQFRTFRYTLELMSYIKTSEHLLYELQDVPGFGVGRIFAKNMNPRAKAMALREKMLSIPGCHVIELDAHRFDAHVNEWLLRLEHRFWTKTSLNQRRLGKILSWQIQNTGYATAKNCRIKYRVRGGRMSGDANTAGGNCLIMSSMLKAFGDWSGRRFTFLCDGDDSVFFHDGEVISDEEIHGFFQQFGMDMAVENRPSRFEDINFCQAKPVSLSDPEQYTMLRDPSKIISKIGVSDKMWDVKHRWSYLRTKALGELSLVPGCPMLQPFLARIIAICEKQMTKQQLKRGPSKLAIKDSYRLRMQLEPGWMQQRLAPITTVGRSSFENAWGISVTEQLMFEASLEDWDFSLLGDWRAEGVNVQKWTYPWMRPEAW